MKKYSQIQSLSTPIRNTVETAVVDSVLAVRARKLRLFGEDRDSLAALGLASIRTELQRILTGRPVRPEVLERAVQPPAADCPEDGGLDLATDLEAVEVS